MEFVLTLYVSWMLGVSFDSFWSRFGIQYVILISTANGCPMVSISSLCMILQWNTVSPSGGTAPACDSSCIAEPGLQRTDQRADDKPKHACRFCPQYIHMIMNMSMNYEYAYGIVLKNVSFKMSRNHIFVCFLKKPLILFSGGGLYVLEMRLFQLYVGVNAFLSFLFMIPSCSTKFLSCSLHFAFISRHVPFMVHSFPFMFLSFEFIFLNGSFMLHSFAFMFLSCCNHLP